MANPSALTNITIIGASSALGSAVLEALLAASFKITVISRASSNTTFSSGVTVLKLSDSYPGSELVDAFKGQDAVIALLPTFEIRQQFRIIDAAVKAGVKRFVPSEFGLNDLQLKVQDLIPTSKDKGEVIEYLRSKEEAGLSWTAIATGTQIPWALETGYIGIDIRSRKAEYWDSGNVRFNATTLETTGLALVRVFEKPEKTANKFLYIQDFTTSQKDLVEVFERHTGQKWTENSVSSKDRIVRAQAGLSNDYATSIYELILAAVLVDGYGSNFERDEELANEMLELPRHSLDDVITALL